MGMKKRHVKFKGVDEKNRKQEQTKLSFKRRNKRELLIWIKKDD